MQLLTYRLLRACWLILAGMPAVLSAQIIANEQIFPVLDYNIYQYGYPLKVIPAEGGRFQYVEYWTDSAASRPIANYYLQTYTRQYAEQNYQPITKPGRPVMQVRDLLSLAPGAVVIGTQERADGLPHTVAAFFDADGEHTRDSLAQLSCYDRKPRRNYREWIEVSPKGSYLIWMCRNGKDHFASVWTKRGEEVWHNFLALPYLKDKYNLADVAVDDDGTPYFLMMPDKPDPGQPLMLLSYQDTAQHYQELAITPDAAGVVRQADLHLAPDQAILVAGTIEREGSPLLRNGAELDEEVGWSHVFLSRYDRKIRYDLPAEITFRYHAVHALPEEWITRYGEEGANFADYRLVVTNELVIFMAEEQYQRKDRWYCYDLTLHALTLADGSLRWRRTIDKRQRDRGSSSLLSYVAGIARGKLRIVYLTERGASGKLNCTSIDLRDGQRRDKYLASNETSRYLCFPSRSGMVSDDEMVLIGLGNPGQNDYKLITVRF